MKALSGALSGGAESSASPAVLPRRRGMSGTGLKMFTALMLALLPLGIIAILGTIQTIRTAEMERTAMLRVAASQGASRLLSAINDERASLRALANALESDTAAPGDCRRAARLLGAGSGIMLTAYRDDERLCSVGKPLPMETIAETGNFIDLQATIDGSRQRLTVRMTGLKGQVHMLAVYGAAELATMARLPKGDTGTFSEVWLSRGKERLWLVHQGRRPDADLLDSVSVPLNLGAIAFVMETRKPPVDIIRVAAMALPVFLWIAAAGIGWWVVNRYLIRPLIAFNQEVAAYEPGKVLELSGSNRGLAREIDMLGDTFREIAQDVVEHEAQVAAALNQQRALTREVHHRVKNNLQIIASLINLHSRAAASPEALAAYASIQRRVDALSVVHRNHYAAAELSHGIDGQALISELANALRSTAPPAPQFTIRVEGDNLYLSQDVAVPTAFLITELVELVILGGRLEPVSVALRIMGEGSAELSIASPGLRPSAEVDQLLAERFGRVLVGLSRQLRATLMFDAALGRYGIAVPARRL